MVGDVARQQFVDGSSYPPERTGLRGSHPGSYEVAHEIRDGQRWEVDDVLTSLVCHTVSMHRTGVVPPPVAARAPITPPPAIAAAVNTVNTLRIAHPFRGPDRG